MTEIPARKDNRAVLQGPDSFSLYRDSKKSFDCAGISLFFSGKTFVLFSGGFRFFEVRTVPSCGKTPFFLRVNTERKKATLPHAGLGRIEALLLLCFSSAMETLRIRTSDHPYFAPFAALYAESFRRLSSGQPRSSKRRLPMSATASPFTLKTAR